MCVFVFVQLLFFQWCLLIALTLLFDADWLKLFVVTPCLVACVEKECCVLSFVSVIVPSFVCYFVISVFLSSGEATTHLCWGLDAHDS